MKDIKRKDYGTYWISWIWKTVDTMKHATKAENQKKEPYRSEFSDIPAEILGYGHHLVDNALQLVVIENAVAVAVVEAEHELQFVFRSSAFQQGEITHDVLQRDLRTKKKNSFLFQLNDA